MSGRDRLIAQAPPGLVALHDAREPLRVAIASLARGGAERIVLEWLGAEAARGRDVEIAVLHQRRHAWPAPAGVRELRRGRESPERFFEALARHWRGLAAPVSTHLIADELLRVLWLGGVRTVPVVHNTSEGWRNDPACWDPGRVPLAIACADAVRAELLAAGCRVPVVTLRHRPSVGAGAFDLELRQTIREELGIPADAFVVCAAGGFKKQKDYPRAVRVLACLARLRPAVLLILGGVLDRRGLAELDSVMDEALERGVAAQLRLPGFVETVEPYLAASDAWLNVSGFEGLSMATQEAVAAGLPVVATDVGGQRELAGEGIERIVPDASAEAIAAALARFPVRTTLVAQPMSRAPRVWSLSLASREPALADESTLFVTANLNAGGAQRSLVNLAVTLAPLHRLAVAVCGESTDAWFSARLAAAGVDAFRPAADADPVAVAESLIAGACARNARTVCFWNVDPKVKLLVAKFAPETMRLVDASPGAYAFEELEAASAFAAAIGFSPAQFHRRLDVLVLKYHASNAPECRGTVVIPNGVAFDARAPRRSRPPRFVVYGRIAPSKRIEVILEAFRELIESHPAARLHVVGTAEARHADYAARLQAAACAAVRFDGADFEGAVFDSPLTAAIVLGTNQGCPNVVLEAMAAGVPVIANASGGTAELLAEEAGWLLPEDVDAGQVLEAMRAAIADPARAERQAALARARVRAAYTLERMARRYLEVLAPGSMRK